MFVAIFECPQDHSVCVVAPDTLHIFVLSIFEPTQLVLPHSLAGHALLLPPPDSFPFPSDPVTLTKAACVIYLAFVNLKETDKCL